MSEQLQDEITSINSIYEQDTLEDLAGSSSIYTLTHPLRPEISIRVEFPPDYPDAPPSVLGTQSTGPNTAKGQGQQLVELVRSVLGEVFTPGSPCVFDLIEETTARLEQLGLSAPTDPSNGSQATEKSGEDTSLIGPAHADDQHQQADDLGEEPPWIISDVVTEKKSVFVARAAPVYTTEEAKRYLRHLLAVDKKASKATHNITAWRILGDNGVQYQDCDDDGETAAGGRVLHLLELMGAWNLMVVVSRWYGGVHLGPDRFRIINQVAREAVLKGGSVETDTKKKPRK